jgi:hypothetical protein
MDTVLNDICINDIKWHKNIRHAILRIYIGNSATCGLFL